MSVSRNTHGIWRYRKWIHLPNGERLRVTGIPGSNTREDAERAERDHCDNVLKAANECWRDGWSIERREERNGCLTATVTWILWVRDARGVFTRDAFSLLRQAEVVGYARGRGDDRDRSEILRTHGMPPDDRAHVVAQTSATLAEKKLFWPHRSNRTPIEAIRIVDEDGIAEKVAAQLELLRRTVGAKYPQLKLTKEHAVRALILKGAEAAGLTQRKRK